MLSIYPSVSVFASVILCMLGTLLNRWTITPPGGNIRKAPNVSFTLVWASAWHRPEGEGTHAGTPFCPFLPTVLVRQILWDWWYPPNHLGGCSSTRETPNPNHVSGFFMSWRVPTSRRIRHSAESMALPVGASPAVIDHAISPFIMLHWAPTWGLPSIRTRITLEYFRSSTYA